MQRSLLRAARTVALVAALLALTGFTYDSISRALEQHRDPEPGHLVNIGDRSLNLNCTGSGAPTVILESGLGDGIGEWRTVQPAVSHFTRVCSYDRAGYDASDPAPFPRTSATIAEDLHRLLQAAGEHPPYVLVGHSFGGYNVRVFNGHYPNEVSAMVLVDSTQEDQYQRLPPSWNALGTSMLAHYQSLARWSPITVPFGILRFRLWLQGAHVPSRLLQVKYLRARASELEQIQTSAEQARASGSLGAKPLIVLTGGKNNDASLKDFLSPADIAEYGRLWVDDLQPRLAALSEQGKRIVLQDSGHDIPTDRPDAITSAVQEVSARQKDALDHTPK